MDVFDESKGLYVAGQLSTAEFKDASAKVKSVLNLRSSTEEGYLASEALQMHSLGIVYVHSEVKLSEITEQGFDLLMAQLDILPRPCLIHCRSAKRARAVAAMFLATREAWSAEQTSEIFTKVDNCDEACAAYWNELIEQYLSKKAKIQANRGNIVQSELDSQVFQGAQPSLQQLQELSAVIKSVVDLRDVQEGGHIGMGVNLREKDYCESLKIGYTRSALSNDYINDPSSEAFKAAVQAVATAKRPVLIHSGVTGARANALVAHVIEKKLMSSTQDTKQTEEGFQALIDAFDNNEDAPMVRRLRHQGSSTCVYVAWDRKSKEAIIVDPVVDFVIAAGEYYYDHADTVLDVVRENALTVKYIIETHVHADHITACQYLKEQLGNDAQICIGSQITQVQTVFSKAFNLTLPCDGSQFDKLIEPNETLKMGRHVIKALHTPGHTPVCTSYVVDEHCVFSGDTLFMPDIGTARCDFPGGSVESMYASAQKLLGLPGACIMMIGHDYPGDRRPFRFAVSIKEQQETNKMVKLSIKEQEYILVRAARDATLGPPSLLLPSLQVNIDAGNAPAKESNDTSYLKIPYVRVDFAEKQAAKTKKKMTAQQALKDYHDHSL